jgi:phosphotransferase system HPr (HPr) family protein
MAEIKLQVKHKSGLHARPASLFVQTAAKFSSQIKVKNLTTNGEFVDAKSIIMVLTLGVMHDHEILIQADGADAQTAIDALSSLIETNFGDD